jgi:hypothetical protein
MLPPSFFTDARRRAPHFVSARVIGWNGLLDVRVARVFRGSLRRGDRLALAVSLGIDRPAKLGDSTLWASMQDVLSAPYVEVFLDGDPPAIVCDQIEYLKRSPCWGASGDPSREAFIW